MARRPWRLCMEPPRWSWREMCWMLLRCHAPCCWTPLSHRRLRMAEVGACSSALGAFSEAAQLQAFLRARGWYKGYRLTASLRAFSW